MGIASAAWCIACGQAPLVAISYERDGVMAHYGACRVHVLVVAERAMHDLDRLDNVQKVAGYIDVSHEALESRPVRDVTWHGREIERGR